MGNVEIQGSEILGEHVIRIILTGVAKTGNMEQERFEARTILIIKRRQRRNYPDNVSFLCHRIVPAFTPMYVSLN